MSGFSSGTMVKLICFRSVVMASSIALSSCRDSSTLVPPHHADDDTLDLNVFGRGDDRLHRRIGGLQPDAPLLAIELLEGHVGAIQHRDHRLAILGAAAVLDDHVITVA